jgi:3-ketosteroid 9alpha-monooxygenase subunit A
MTPTQVDHRRFPYHTFPTGWYQVAFSDELSATAIPKRYFERDVVLYRGESGQAYVFDAHCPHLGAHIGYGGTVVGDEIACPFHGWRFDADGVNCLIPYAERPNRSRLLFKWDVVERAGMVLAWYDALRRPPSWLPDPLPEVEADPERFPEAARFRRTWERVRLKPQFIIENLVDAAHQKYVHGAHEVPEIVDIEPDGPRFRVHNVIKFGEGKAKTWLTQDGRPRIAALKTEASGLGIAVARFELDQAIHVQTVTPIDHEYCESTAYVLLTGSDVIDREPSEAARRRFAHECKQFDRDVPIWEHQIFVHPAPFPAGESKRFHTVRRWATQFYPEALEGHFGKFKEGYRRGVDLAAAERPAPGSTEASVDQLSLTPDA